MTNFPSLARRGARALVDMTLMPPTLVRMTPLLVTLLLVTLVACGSDEADTGRPGPAPLAPMAEEAEPPELAPYMGELQRLVHKLSLSVAASNPKLASFYAHESMEQLERIQEELPEYEGQPVAMLIGRLALPAVKRVAEATKKADRSGEVEPMREAVHGLVAACNKCHQLTLHGYIHITEGTGVNPFNQDFAP